jgi:acetyl-CoA carboxylase biotin carboxyl carrier protein
MPNLDLDLVRHALSVARSHGFAEVELGVGADAFTAKLEPLARKQTLAEQIEEAEVIEKESVVDVRATLVGYFRHPKQPVEVGARVSKGDVVAVIAALGISNDIEAPEEGEVVEVSVQQNQAVEFGQVLVRIKP